MNLQPAGRHTKAANDSGGVRANELRVTVTPYVTLVETEVHKKGRVISMPISSSKSHPSLFYSIFYSLFCIIYNNITTASCFGMATKLQEQSQTAFSRVLDTLSPEWKNDFQFSTLADLEQVIHEIQRKQGSERRLRNMARLRSFLDAMKEYGKVIEVFLNASNFVAFIWVRPGPNLY